MAGNKKSLLASLIKDLVGTKSSAGSKENDERKKELIKETLKESATASGGSAGEDAAMVRILNMLETQLNVKTSALEEEASKRRDAELEVQKLQQQLIKLESDQKREESDKKLNAILHLVDTFGSEDSTKEKDEPKASKDNRKQGGRGGRGKAFNRPNWKEGNGNEKGGNKPNFDSNLNKPEHSKMNKCQNKLFNDQNLSHYPNTNFNVRKNNQQPAAFNPPPLMNQPNNFIQGNQGPMNNFNPMKNNPFLNQPSQHFNQPLMNQPFPNQNTNPSFHNQNMNQPFPNQNMNQSFPNQNMFHHQPNNFGPRKQFNQPEPNIGFNIPPSSYNQFPNQGENQHQFHNARGRGGFNRGRGNFRGNFRGGMSPRGGKQFDRNNSSGNNDKVQEDGFVVVSKPDFVRGPNKNYTKGNHTQDGHSQNIQKTTFKKKRNRNRPAKQDREDRNKDKEKDNDFDSESVMQGMIDVFSKMFGSITSQPAKPNNDQPQQPEKLKNDQQSDKPKSAQQTGAIKKELSGKTHNKTNKKKEGYQQTKGSKEEKNNPFKLFVGSGFPSEEEAKAKNINLNLEVKDIIMVAKHEGSNVTEQPKTLLDMTNFKKKYPNASAIVVSDEH